MKKQKKSDIGLMQLSSSEYITKSDARYQTIDKWCFLSKNLCNACIYEQNKKKEAGEKYMSSYDLVKHMSTETENVDFRAMPNSRMAGFVAQNVGEMFKSKIALLSKKKKESGKNRIGSAGYLPKDGRFVVTIDKQMFSRRFSDGNIHLGFDKNVVFHPMNCKFPDVSMIKIVPCYGRNVEGSPERYKITYVHDVKMEDQKPDNGIYCGVDLGVHNIMSVVFNSPDIKSFIVDGSTALEIGQFYNKQTSHYRSMIPSKTIEFDKKNEETGEVEHVVKTKPSVRSTKRIDNIAFHRNMAINDFIYRCSDTLVCYCVDHNVSKIVVGYNKGWKNEADIGKKNTQNFVQIPFLNLVHEIEYKCKLNGISFSTVEESHTSKCSFIDMEPIEHHDVYVGCRKKRGLFVSSNGVEINADLNGAANILRRGVGDENMNPSKIDLTSFKSPDRIKPVDWKRIKS